MNRFSPTCPCCSLYRADRRSWVGVTAADPGAVGGAGGADRDGRSWRADPRFSRLAASRWPRATRSTRSLAAAIAAAPESPYRVEQRRRPAHADHAGAAAAGAAAACRTGAIGGSFAAAGGRRRRDRPVPSHFACSSRARRKAPAAAAAAAGASWRACGSPTSAWARAGPAWRRATSATWARSVLKVDGGVQRRAAADWWRGIGDPAGGADPPPLRAAAQLHGGEPRRARPRPRSGAEPAPGQSAAAEANRARAHERRCPGEPRALASWTSWGSAPPTSAPAESQRRSATADAAVRLPAARVAGLRADGSTVEQASGMPFVNGREGLGPLPTSTSPTVIPSPASRPRPPRW